MLSMHLYKENKGFITFQYNSRLTLRNELSDEMQIVTSNLIKTLYYIKYRQVTFYIMLSEAANSFTIENA